MKTIRMSIALASMVGAASFFLVAPAATSASPGKGWDIFWGEPIATESSYERTVSAAPSQGFDLFNTGYGTKVGDFEHAYMGTSQGSAASSGWDIYNMREGDPVR